MYLPQFLDAFCQKKTPVTHIRESKALKGENFPHPIMKKIWDRYEYSNVFSLYH
jgi:hypothetical protein